LKRKNRMANTPLCVTIAILPHRNVEGVLRDDLWNKNDESDRLLTV
jgi:hypothetical protein